MVPRLRGAHLLPLLPHGAPLEVEGVHEGGEPPLRVELGIVSKWDGFPWPPPATKADIKKWESGVKFALKGGPYDGVVLRLWPHPYPSGVSGWDEVYVEGSRYVRPQSCDPYMTWSGTPNKTRSNCPWMEFAEASDERVPVAA